MHMSFLIAKTVNRLFFKGINVKRKIHHREMLLNRKNYVTLSSSEMKEKKSVNIYSAGSSHFDEF